MQLLERGTASKIIEELTRLGVVDFCVCPAARNAEFVSLLDESDSIKPFYHYEERSAAFFALGCARRTKKPVAVITTSGTAAGELLPACMEAYYTGVPLILITADRPRRFRGTGAPQAAEQVNLFGPYAPISKDIANDEELDLSDWDQKSPLHLNVCLEDPTSKIACPNVVKRDEFSNIDHFFASVSYPFIIVSALQQEEKNSVLNFLMQVNCPVYLEGVSGLRENSQLKHLQITNPDHILQNAAGSGYPIDGVLRIGGIPTFRLWRDLEESTIKVFSISNLPFKGLTHGTLLHTNLESFSYLIEDKIFKFKEWIQQDQQFQQQLQSRFLNEPQSSPSLIHRLSLQLPKHSHVYVGNSLPIREWDLAASFEDKQFHVTASRGLNGIDGQMSTFFGLCSKECENFAILGDLTTLYDMAAPWVLPQMDGISATVFVINNGGGKIFSRMFTSEVFQNKHELNFKPLAELWGMEYELWDGEIKALIPSRIPRLIEIQVKP